MTTVKRLRRRQRIETAFLVVLLVFSVAQSAYFNRVDSQRQDAERAQVERNSAENDCQTAYAVALTQALQDRDTAATIAREAAVDLWRTFRRLLVDPPAGGPTAARLEFLDSLATYLTTLRRVSRTADINPYPNLEECFEDIEARLGDGSFPAFRLSSYQLPRHRRECFGRPVTIRGTPNGDVINGTDGPDVIAALGGTDLINAGGGRDRICAGPGGDVVSGARGYDRANCGRGGDVAFGVEYRRAC